MGYNETMPEGQEIPLVKPTKHPDLVRKHMGEGLLEPMARKFTALKLLLDRSRGRVAGLDKEVKQLEAEMVIDPLTMAYTKQYFNKQLAAAFSLIQREIVPNPAGRAVRAKEDAHQIGVLMFDLDNFKSVNDEYGHPEGDRVLKEFSETMRFLIRQEDVFARLGGEEFGLIIRETEQLRPDYVARLAERFRDSVSRRVYVGSGDQLKPVTVSIGMTLYPNGSPINSPEDLISYADKALYKAKEGGRNQVVKFTGVNEQGEPQFSRVDVSPNG